jgi:hypothetical protein
MYSIRDALNEGNRDVEIDCNGGWPVVVFHSSLFSPVVLFPLACVGCGAVKETASSSMDAAC